MKATNVIDGQAALLDRAAALTGTGNPLPDVTVTDLYGRDMGEKAIYGGGGRFTQGDAAGERGVLKFETDTVGLYIRVFLSGLDVRTAKQTAAAIGTTLATNLAVTPQLGNGLTWVGIVGGTFDVYPVDEAYEVVLALSCQIESYLQ